MCCWGSGVYGGFEIKGNTVDQIWMKDIYLAFKSLLNECIAASTTDSRSHLNQTISLTEDIFCYDNHLTHRVHHSLKIQFSATEKQTFSGSLSIFYHVLVNITSDFKTFSNIYIFLNIFSGKIIIEKTSPWTLRHFKHFKERSIEEITSKLIDYDFF